ANGSLNFATVPNTSCRMAASFWRLITPRIRTRRRANLLMRCSNGYSSERASWPMIQQGGFRGNGHLWAGMGASSLRDGPPLLFCRDGACPVSIRGRRRASRPSTGIEWYSESHEHRLRIQQNPPRFLHAVLDLILQPDNIACFRGSAVDQRQRMLLRDPRRSRCISFGEARMFDQPRR